MSPADEWLIAYALPPAELVSVKLFAIGHSLELHLKAAFTKLTGDLDGAVSLGHRIDKALREVKNLSPSLLSGYSLRPAVLATDLFRDDATTLSEEDNRHFEEHRELYTVAKIHADLKYLGAPMKWTNSTFRLRINHPNNYWIHMLKELRSFIDKDSPGRTDWVKKYVDAKSLDFATTYYLSKLY